MLRWVVCVHCVLWGLAVSHAGETPSLAGQRIVCLGDSITDGQTYSLLAEQALQEAGKPLPKFFGAGIGGDTAAGMFKRLDRDVLVHRPTLVMLSCGINDAGGGVKTPDYENTVTAIVQRLQAAKVQVLLLTTTNLRAAEHQARIKEFNAALYRIATRYGLTVAEVFDRMEEGRAREKTLWEADGCHLNFAGYRYMTRAVLDALGYRDVPVPRELHVAPLPGILPQWKVLAIKEERPALDEKTVGAVRPDDRWQSYNLPESKPVASWWFDHERQRGVALSLQEMFGPAKSFLVAAEVDSPQEKAMFVNTGGEVAAVWLNGKPIFGRNDPTRGWHPGAYRVPAQLRAGKNLLVVETNARFFVSLTETNDW